MGRLAQRTASLLLYPPTLVGQPPGGEDLRVGCEVAEHCLMSDCKAYNTSAIPSDVCRPVTQSMAIIRQFVLLKQKCSSGMYASLSNCTL